MQETAFSSYYPESPVSPELPLPRISPPSSISDHNSEDFVSESDLEEDDYNEEQGYDSSRSHSTIPSSLGNRRGKAVPALALVRSKESLTDARKSGGSIGTGPKFTATRPSKRRVRISPGILSPLSPSPRMIDICFENAMPRAVAPRRASMLVPASPRWTPATPDVDDTPSVCASSNVLGHADKTNFALKTDDLRKVTMLSAQEQVNKFLTLQHLQNLEEKVQSPAPSTKHTPGDAQSVLSPRQVPLPLSPRNEQIYAPLDNVPDKAQAVQRSMSLKTFPPQKPNRMERSQTARSPRGYVHPLPIIDAQARLNIYPGTNQILQGNSFAHTPVTPQIGAGGKELPLLSHPLKKCPKRKIPNGHT